MMPLAAEPLLPLLLAAMHIPATRDAMVINEIELAGMGHGRRDVTALVLLRPEDVRLGHVTAASGVDRHHPVDRVAGSHEQNALVIDHARNELLGGAIDDPALLA